MRAAIALRRPISRRTVGRILDADAIKPWRYEHWIFPRDPRFAPKAGRVLDLYAGLWQGERLDPEDRILSADEKTSIQARIRCHASLGRLQLYEELSNSHPYPFDWKFDRKKLTEFLRRLAAKQAAQDAR